MCLCLLYLNTIAAAVSEPGLLPPPVWWGWVPALTPAPDSQQLSAVQNRAADHLGHRVRGDRDPGVRDHPAEEVFHFVPEPVQAREEAAVQHSVRERVHDPVPAAVQHTI